MLSTKKFGFLSKQHIRHASEFDAVFKYGSRITDGSCFTFHYVKTERTYPRLGMVISKRNCALAVDRNWIKRTIREQFRLNQHSFPGIDLVVALRSSTHKISNQELHSCIEKLFSQLMKQCDGSSSS